MKTESNHEITLKPLLNNVTQGNCVDLLKQMPSESVDLLLTDPPYVPRYQSSDGRTVPNDNFTWLNPAMSESFRVLRPHSFAIVFYGWTHVDKFVAAFRGAGFWLAGHLVFRKRYTSARRYLAYRHESAYLLAKGHPAMAGDPIADVRDWEYSFNRLHPTQKPVSALLPLVEAFSKRGQVVLDPFCGSGTSLVAAKQLGRHFVGFDISPDYAAIATRRLNAHPQG
ncbi:MAG TPA: DNA methyltransferase [Candidatus Angelobacter sp.]|nr:DNA methyltransferase [Candidatus Angelobacter sp.]